MTDVTDVAVIGAGPAGLCAALAIAHTRLNTVLIAAPHRPAGDKPDNRTAALFNPSINLLRNLGAWETQFLNPINCAPLTGIRLIDDTGGLFRAPEVNFQAAEIGEPAFGYNVPQEPLIEALRNSATRLTNLEIIETQGAREISPSNEKITIRTAEGETIDASLVVAADGRKSLSRKAAGIEAQTNSCDQTAVVCTFAHSRPHHGISTEFHRKAGPMTVVPMPGNISSLVWVERPSTANRLMQLSDRQFLETLETNLQGLLGELTTPSPRAAFPLSHMTSSSMGRNRIALVGEAGHAMPPIGAQGLNLSLRDVAVLTELLQQAIASNEDIGGPKLLDNYNAARTQDANERSFAVKTMNEVLLSDYLPVQLARGAGLHAIHALAPLRQTLMKLGMAPPRKLPTLMQGDPSAA